jgi:hypothetical protein
MVAGAGFRRQDYARTEIEEIFWIESNGGGLRKSSIH